MRIKVIMLTLITDIIDNLLKNCHSRESGNPGALNFLKRMDSRLRTPDYKLRGQASGMTALKIAFYEAVIIQP
jgi:hypothetical protein